MHKKESLFPFLCMVFLSMSVAVVDAGSSFDVSTLDGSNGLIIVGATSNAHIGVTLLSIADVQGDGGEELLVGAPDLGEVYLIYSSALRAAGDSFNVCQINGTNGVLFSELTPGDELGFSLAVGDFNGDGFQDLALGAPSAASNAGRVYVIFGSASPLPHPFDLSSLNGVNGFVLEGGVAGDEAGVAVAFGDINGDGLDELIVGAPSADPGGLLNAGQVEIVYGNSSWTLALITATMIDGVNGVRLRGDTAGDGVGTSLCARSDLNNDTLSDLAIGAPGGDPGGFSAAGDVYVLFGDNGVGWSSPFVMSSLNGVNGFIASGGENNGRVGDRNMACGQDLNGDGQSDLVIGSWGATVNPGSLIRAGKTFVLYGRVGSPGLTVPLLSMSSTEGIMIQGETALTESGSAFAVAESNLLIGAPHILFNGPGTTYELEGPLLSSLDLVNVDGGPVNGTKFPGIGSNDLMGSAMVYARINPDNSHDVILSAPQATAGTHTEAGVVYVVFGAIPTPTPTPSPTPSASPSPSPSPTPSASPSPSLTPSPSPSPTSSPSPSPSPSATPSSSPSPSPSASPSASPSTSPSFSPTPSASPSPTATLSPLPTMTASPSPTPTVVPICGNGILEIGEECDSTNNPCCTDTCQFASSGSSCGRQNACTSHVCNAAGTCVQQDTICSPPRPDACFLYSCHPRLGCLIAPLCDDGDPCTIDTCTGNGICTHEPDEACLRCADFTNCDQCNSKNCAWLSCSDDFQQDTLSISDTTIQLNLNTSAIAANQTQILHACFPKEFTQQTLNLTLQLSLQQNLTENACRVNTHCDAQDDDATTDNKLQKNKVTIATAAGGAAGSVAGGTAFLWGGTATFMAYRRRKMFKKQEFDPDPEWVAEESNDIFMEKDRKSKFVNEAFDDRDLIDLDM